MMQRGRRAGSSSGSAGRARRSQHASRRQIGAEAEPSGADRRLDPGRVEWGGELIWVVGFTEGGAPYWLRTTDFEAAELETMGLDPGLAGSRDNELGWWDPGHQSGAAGTPS